MAGHIGTPVPVPCTYLPLFVIKTKFRCLQPASMNKLCREEFAIIFDLHLIFPRPLL